MKKIGILGALICTLFITGCGCSKKEEKTIVCKVSENEEKYEIDSTITVKYDNKTNDIISLEELSTLTSNENEILEDFRTTNDNYYTNYGKYYNSDINDNKAQISIKLDFDKVSTDDFIKMSDSNYGYLTDDKIDYKKIISYYIDFEGYDCN